MTSFRLGLLRVRWLSLAAVLAVASCGSPAPTAKATRDSPGAETMSHEMGPFFRAEADLDDALTDAVGVDIADTWVRKMIEHRRGTIRLSQVLLEMGGDGHIAEMAERLARQQDTQIDALMRLQRRGDPDVESALVYSDALDGMHDETMAALGANAGESWLRKMLAHSRGGIVITDILLTSGDVPPATKKLAVRTRSELAAQAGTITRMLNQGVMPARPSANHESTEP